MSNIQDAIYTITFDNDMSVDYKCKVNVDTRQMFDLEHIEHDNGFDWIDQCITLPNGKVYDVHYVEYCEDPEKHVWYWWE